MKLHIQRLVVLLAVLVLCVTSLVLPCQAADAPRRGFQDWASARGGGFGYEDEAYQKFIDDLNNAYGSVVFDSEGGYWIDVRITDINRLVTYDAVVESFVRRGGGFNSNATDIISFDFKSETSMKLPRLGLAFEVSDITLPAGILTYRDIEVLSTSFTNAPEAKFYGSGYDSLYVQTNGEEKLLTRSGVVVADGSKILDTRHKRYACFSLDFKGLKPGVPTFVVCSLDLRKVFYFVPAVLSTDVINNTESRPGSLFGDIIYVGDDGSQMVADEIFIVNEGDSTVYNPVTGDTWNIETWTYDYSTRTYEITTTTGNTVNVTYGDENITINEGGNTINIYYGGSGGGNNPDVPVDPDNPDTPVDPDQPDKEESWFSKIINAIASFLGDTIGALLDLIGSVIVSFLENLKQVVLDVITHLTDLTTLFGSFGEAIRAIWTWLPDEIVTIMVAAVSVVIFGALIRLLIK